MSAPHDAILARNLAAVRTRIAAACARRGRASGDITLIAVTKYTDASVMDALAGLGVADVGENRLQVAEPKFAAMSTRPRRHFIGPLQTNKVKRVLELFDVIHSLGRMELARALDKRATEAGIGMVPCFVQVNVSGEEAKGGFAPDELPHALDAILGATSRLELVGLMTMPPVQDAPETSRPYFSRLRELRDEQRARGLARAPLAGLSMGMSGDFEIAVEEGATHVRVGTALYEGLRAGG